ncbi:MAG TPA: FAD-dependent monooxygenase [Candidatus Dormibacteraeota bacterium]|nr:FAD-dependent monooxygenase [Candidatus Dormibacteraeota bacterium]
MPKAVTDTDVLIVGAGPVGLFLANECARRAIRYRIVECRPSQSEHSKALAIFPRTLEIFDMAGVASPIVERANRVTCASVISHGRTLARMQFTPHESPYPYVAMVPQDITEKLLVDALHLKGRSVEYDSTFVSATQADDCVHATLEHQGDRRDIAAAYVVGCDGAHSAVRHLLNLPFEGAEYHDSFLLADVETNEALPADEMQLCPHELGPLAIFPMSAIRRRIVAMVDKAEDDAPSLALVRQMLAARAPAGIEARSLHWSSYFRIHHRQVAKLRVRRIFIAGDAAHIHSPFGGQGMNTGLQDVWNLVWKLDFALRGFGGENLLDSYTAERRPVIKHVIDVTDFMTRAMATPSKLAQAARNTIIPVVSRLAPFQHAFVQTLSELGIAYRGSPMVEGPGERYFDDGLRGGRICSRFLLLIDEAVDASISDAAKQFCASFSEVLELRSVHLPRATQIMLVRPDGYVAYASGSRDAAAALVDARSVLERNAG